MIVAMPTLERPPREYLNDAPASVRRDQLRENTAYPFLRKIGLYWIGFSFVYTGTLWLVVVYLALNSTAFAPVVPWVVASILSTLSIFATIFINGVAQALVDLGRSPPSGPINDSLDSRRSVAS